MHTYQIDCNLLDIFTDYKKQKNETVSITFRNDVPVGRANG